jgi:hypothetical protein
LVFSNAFDTLGAASEWVTRNSTVLYETSRDDAGPL